MAQASIETRDMDQLSKDTGNVYESVAIISKRARQVAVNVKEELNSKLAEFASTVDNLEEIFENREQIEMAQRSQSRNLQPRNFGGNFNRMSRPGCCFVCGDPSHYKRDCPQFRPRGGYQNFGRGWRGPPSYGQQFRPQSGFHQTHQVNHVGQYPNASGNDFDAGYKKGLEDAAKKVAEHESLVRNVNAACEEKGDESYWFFSMVLYFW